MTLHASDPGFYRSLVEGFASLVGMKAPDFGNNGVCAYQLPQGSHFEIAPARDGEGLLMFGEVQRGVQDSADAWKRRLQKNLEICNPYGLFLVSDQRDGAIYLTRHLPLWGATPERLSEAADTLLNVLESLRAEEDDQNGAEAAFSPELTTRLI